MGDFKDCDDCGHEPGDCLFCSDVTKNMFKPKTENREIYEENKYNAQDGDKG